MGIYRFVVKCLNRRGDGEAMMRGETRLAGNTIAGFGVGGNQRPHPLQLCVFRTHYIYIRKGSHTSSPTGIYRDCGILPPVSNEAVGPNRRHSTRNAYHYQTRFNIGV